MLIGNAEQVLSAHAGSFSAMPDILREAALSDGTATDIGKTLFIATSTVRFHLSHLLRKTGFSTRKELAEAFLAEMEEHA
ncbi:MAG: hypothetical protein IJ741_09550 [Schwartzia sp.]|nr:hypothetical protein [Schwartzia sp. (in: firmicutes)]MBR1761405.1 hypothetical protein [Schwartzia sp. (in: firmicutes)]